MKKITLILVMFITSLSYAQYCDSTPSSNDASGISNVQLMSTDFAGSDVTYLDFTGAAVDIQAGTMVNAMITFQTGYSYDTHIWIDFGDDDSFAEAGDLVYSGESLGSNPTTLDASFSLGASSALGVHRMRIGTADSGQGTPNPCYSGSYGVSVDLDVNITAAPSCLPPTALTATGITATDAVLGWTESGTASLYNVEVVTAGTTPTGTATDTGVANGFTKTGLTANTGYEFYVQSDCTGGDVSTWSGPFAFTTECNVFTAPYTQDFENAGDIPDCWSNTGDDTWEFNLTGPNYVGNAGTISGSTDSGNYYAVLDDSDPSSTDGALVSPLVDVSGLTTPALSFYEISTVTATQDNATLTVEVFDGSSWNTVGTFNTNTDGWEEKIIDISGLTFTGAAQARFTVIDSGSFYDDIAIDDVSFKEAPSCYAPTALVASTITATTAELAWTESGTASLYNVEVVTAGTTPTGTATDTGVANPFNKTGLTANTDYEFYVQADCGATDGVSPWTGPFAFTTSCAAISTFPSATDFTNNTPTNCWGESGSGEVTDGPTGSTSDWRENRAYLNAAGDTVNSNALNLYQSVDREWLVSPTYTIPSGTPHGLLVQVAVTNYSSSSTPTTTSDTMGSDDEVKLLMTTDNGATWTTLTTWNVGNQPSVNGTDFVADLSAVTGDVKFALWGSDGTTDDSEDYDFHVGAFRVETMASLSTSSFETNDFSFKFYPNPVQNKLTISSITEISSIEVFNVLGQTVLRSNPNTTNTKLDMSQLNGGAYFVKVVSGNNAKTIRIIKN